MTGCPVKKDAWNVVKLSTNLTKALRKLRRDLQACRRCEAYPDCPVIERFNAQVSEAVMQVNEEWGLG